MKKYLLCLFLFMFSSPCYGEYMTGKDKVYLTYASKAVKHLEKKFGIHCCATSIESKEKIEVIGLSFQLNKEVKLNQARNCVINVMREYIHILNSYSELIPYMSNNPITERNVEVVIYFRTKDEDSVDKPYFSIAAWSKNRFSFYLGNKGDYSFPRQITYEKYSDALEKAGICSPPSFVEM